MTVSAAAVSRVLGKKYTRSVSYSTRVRGYRSYNEGFVVEGATSRDFTVVRHRGRSGYLSPEEWTAYVDAVEAKVALYATALFAAGYVCKVVGEGTDTRVHVIGKES